MTETPGADVSADVKQRLTAAFCTAVDAAEGYELAVLIDLGISALVAYVRAHPEDAAAVLAEGAAVRTEGRIWGSEDTTNVAPQWHEASADFIQAHVGLWPAQVRTVICGPWREVPTSEENA